MSRYERNIFSWSIGGVKTHIIVVGDIKLRCNTI